MFQSFIKWPKIILSAVYEKISEKANNGNTSLKKYIGNDENIDHISAVVYDILPFAVKIGLRFEDFNKKFHLQFKTFRDKIYSYENELQKDKQEKEFTINKEIPDNKNFNLVEKHSLVEKNKPTVVNQKDAIKPAMLTKKVIAKTVAKSKAPIKSKTATKAVKMVKKAKSPIKTKPAAMTAFNKRKTDE